MTTADDMRASLDAALDAYEVPEQGSPEREAFRVTDDRKAAWAMRRLATLQQRREGWTGFAKDEKDRIDSWLRDQLADTADDVQFFERLLTDYAVSERRFDSRRKSVDTPHGRVTTRQGEKWEWNDEIALKSLNDLRPDLVKSTTTEAVDKNEVKAQVKAGALIVTESGGLATKDGESVDGITVVKEALTAKVAPDLSGGAR